MSVVKTIFCKSKEELFGISFDKKRDNKDSTALYEVRFPDGMTVSEFLRYVGYRGRSGDWGRVYVGESRDEPIIEYDKFGRMDVLEDSAGLYGLLPIKSIESVGGYTNMDYFITLDKALGSPAENHDIKSEAALVNDIAFYSEVNGADIGGPYENAKDKMGEALNKWIRFNGIENQYTVKRVEREFRGVWWKVLQIARIDDGI